VLYTGEGFAKKEGLTLIWLFLENHPTEKIANHAWFTFWYVVPTLPMFLIFP